MNYLNFKTGLTESMTISTADYIYPNRCNNITCTYQSAIDRNTLFTVRNANGNTLFEKNINQRLSSNLCLLDSREPCNAIGICWCDPAGFSTRICYNHTSGGEGQLTLKCATYAQNREKISTIAGNYFLSLVTYIDNKSELT